MLLCVECVIVVTDSEVKSDTSAGWTVHATFVIESSFCIQPRAERHVSIASRICTEDRRWSEPAWCSHSLVFFWWFAEHDRMDQSNENRECLRWRTILLAIFTILYSCNYCWRRQPEFIFFLKNLPGTGRWSHFHPAITRPAAQAPPPSSNQLMRIWPRAFTAAWRIERVK